MSKEELANCELVTPQNVMAERLQMTEVPDGYSLRQRGPQIGWALFQGDEYLASYMGMQECLLDLAYHWDSHAAKRTYAGPLFRYRGVCSEMFWPTDTISRYVCYGNKLSDIFEGFAVHERRAIAHDKVFTYGVQGSGIHIFNFETQRYELLVGGEALESATEIMHEIKAEHKTIQTNLPKDVAVDIQTNGWDVFISYKSEFYSDAKKVYDLLQSWGKQVFLSEVSLPKLADADYCLTISECLEQAKHLIVIADSKENLLSGWVKYEWESFFNEKLSGRKTGNIVVVLTASMRPEQLPYQLRQVQAVPFGGLDKIREYLR
jgi:hypothetical protein